MHQWHKRIWQSNAISVVMDMQGHSQACTVSECKSAHWFYLHHRQNHAERCLRDLPPLQKYQRLMQSTSPADIKAAAAAAKKAQGSRRREDDTGIPVVQHHGSHTASPAPPSKTYATRTYATQASAECGDVTTKAVQNDLGSGWVGWWRGRWRCLKLETVLKDTACAASIFNCKWKGSTFLDGFAGSLVADPEPQCWHVPSEHYSFPVAQSDAEQLVTPAFQRANHHLPLMIAQRIRGRELVKSKAVTHFIFSCWIGFWWTPKIRVHLRPSARKILIYMACLYL